jgi:hypothetical protein
MDFLRDLLSDQQAQEGYGVLAGEVFGHARSAGIAQPTLNRAKRALSVKSRRIGFGKDGKIYWRLPKRDPSA